MKREVSSRRKSKRTIVMVNNTAVIVDQIRLMCLGMCVIPDCAMCLCRLLVRR